jgi:hypothetical protein
MKKREGNAKADRAKRGPEQLAVAAATVKKYVEGAEFALHLAQDKKFGKRLFSGVGHVAEAWRHAQHGTGLAGTARRLAVDRAVHEELRDARRDLRQAYARVEANKRGHGLVASLTRLTSIAGLISLATSPQVRERVAALIATASRNGQLLQRRATKDQPGRNGTRPRKLEDLTKEQLYARAQEAEIPGRSEMSKEELVDALRARS